MQGFFVLQKIFIYMKSLIKKLLREGLNQPMLFLRWTNSPDDDIRRNFSGHMQAWYDSEEEAMEDYNERKANGEYVESLPKEDSISGMWNADPEWGLSGYGFNDKKSYIKALKNINDIAWHHKDANQQDLVLFQSSNYQLGVGFDGEDTFKDVTNFWYLDTPMNYSSILKLIHEKSH